MDIETVTLSEISQALIFITAFIGSFILIAKYFKKAVEKSSEEVLKQSAEKIKALMKEELNEIADQLNDLSKRFDSLTERDNIGKEALMCLAADRLNQAYNYYLVESNQIDSETFAVLDHLYTSYKNLGGNGLVKKQMEYIQSLRIGRGKLSK